MIKKFEEYISEGFWKDSIKRAKDNKFRIEDIPQPEYFKGYGDIVLYTIPEFPKYYIHIYWSKQFNFEPRILIFYKPREEEPVYGFKNLKSNGVDKRFNIDGGRYYTLNFCDGNGDPDSEEFVNAINNLLKKLPDKAFERTGIKYDIEKKGYPVEGYPDWYIDTVYKSYNENYLIIRHYTNVCRYCEYSYSRHNRGGGICWRTDSNRFQVRDSIMTEDNIFNFRELDWGDGRKPMTNKDISIITSQKFYDAVDNTLSQVCEDDCYKDE